MEVRMVKQGRSDEPQVPLQARDGERHPLFGALKGSAFIPPGVDLMEPADPDWGDISKGPVIPPAQR
jgi:hypothetical protein